MIDLSTKSNRHRLVMFTNLAIIWGAHLAWRCEKNNTVSWSHVGKKTCVNSSVHEFEILYMEVVKLAVPRNHPSHGRPWPRLSIETTMVTWKFPSFRKPPYHINESFKAATHGQVPTHPIRARKNRSAKKPIQPKWPQICSACVLYMYVYYIYTHNLHFHHQQLPFTFMYHTFPRTYKKRQSPLPVINGYNVITCNKWI